MTHRTPDRPDEIRLEQGSDGQPGILYAVRSPGESGIELAQLRFAGGMLAAGCASRHTLMFHLGGERGPISCRIGNQSLVHVSLPGNIAICPADIEFHGEARSSSNYLLLSIPKHSLACFSAERAGSATTLNARLSGYDAQLLAAASELADEAAAGFSSGPSYWNELTDALYDRLLQNYLFDERSGDCTMLGPDVMARINAYVAAHLCEPIDVDTIADVAGKGRFHFPRTFRRSVGMSPYQYLVQLRLRHAIKMIRDSEMSLVEIAAATGFVDQSHLCRWVKRVYGATPTQFAKPLRNGALISRNLQDRRSIDR